MGVLRRMHQPKLNRRQRLSGARRVGLVSSYLFKEVARSAHRPPTQRAGVPGEMAHDPLGIGLVRRADLSIKPRSGCAVLFGRGRA